MWWVWFMVQTRSPGLAMGGDITGTPWGRVTAVLLGRMELGQSLWAQQEWVTWNGGLGHPCRGRWADPAAPGGWPC